MMALFQHEGFVSDRKGVIGNVIHLLRMLLNGMARDFVYVYKNRKMDVLSSSSCCLYRRHSCSSNKFMFGSFPVVNCFTNLLGILGRLCTLNVVLYKEINIGINI